MNTNAHTYTRVHAYTHRQRMLASSTDYVGVVRQRVGELLGLPARALRLIYSGECVCLLVCVCVCVFVYVCVCAVALEATA